MKEPDRGPHGQVLVRGVEIQALDRTQPGLPMKKGRGQTMTHDYKRNGTTTLFAALNTATGEIYHLCQQRHRHHEWLKFLRMIDQTVSAEKQIHIICDNYGTHKHERVQRWMARHKRFHVHFTPTSASWLIDRCINNAIVQRKEKDNSDWTMQPRSFS